MEYTKKVSVCVSYTQEKKRTSNYSTESTESTLVISEFIPFSFYSRSNFWRLLNKNALFSPKNNLFYKKVIVKHFNGRNYCFIKYLLELVNFRCTPFPLPRDREKRGVVGSGYNFFPICLSVSVTEKHIHTQVLAD